MATLFERVTALPLVRQITGSNLQARIIRGTGGTFGLRAFSIVLRFVASLMLARMLGAQKLGIYNFAMAWITFLTVPALFGLERLTVRDLSIYRAQADWPRMAGLLRFASRFATASSGLLMIIGSILAWLTYHVTGRPALLNIELADFAQMAMITLVIALISLPLRTLLLLQQAAIQGLRHVVTAQVPDQVVQPILFLVLMGGLYLIGKQYASSQYAMASQGIATAVALLLGTRLLRSAIPQQARGVNLVFDTRLWMIAAFPFAISNGFNILDQQIDVIMLGMMDSAEAVALYAVTQRGTQLISLLLMSVNIALAPNIAHLHADGNRAELQRIMTHSARLILAGALPIAGFFILWGKPFLSLFGPEFTKAYNVLVILSIGQLVNAATGPGGLLLVMTNREREAAWTIGLSVTLHAVMNIALIPGWGIEGAAIAGSTSIIVANLGMTWFAWRRLGIYATVLGNPASWWGNNS